MSVKNKSIQEKTNDLKAIVDWFDSDSFDLEVAINKFRQAEELSLEIEKDLMSLKNEIQVIKQKFDN